jgi:uncharacterized protein
LIPGLLGFFTGAVIYGLTYQSVFPKISQLANYGSATFESLWSINIWLFILFFALFGLILFYLIDRAGLSRRDKMAETEGSTD